MSSILIQDAYVDIPIFDARTRSLKNNVIATVTGGQIMPNVRNATVIRAIDGISLSLGEGRVGLVGHNGAGKSTLLRVMAGIYEPTAGQVVVEGTVAPMFDLGFGMDHDASGWENIVLRGMLLGHSRREIERKSTEIGALSGLGKFLDMPMRTYSMGMATRLAFAISTSIVPDILLIDEGINAGDAAFALQAKERLDTFVRSAGLLVMASHSDDVLRRWCNSGIWLEHGRVRMTGEIGEVLDAYQADVLAGA